jgi:hypothetical protein
VIFVIVVIGRLQEEELARFEQELMHVTRALTVTIDRELLGVTKTLAALAESPLLDDGQLATFPAPRERFALAPRGVARRWPSSIHEPAQRGIPGEAVAHCRSPISARPQHSHRGPLRTIVSHSNLAIGPCRRILLGRFQQRSLSEARPNTQNAGGARRGAHASWPSAPLPCSTRQQH